MLIHLAVTISSLPIAALAAAASSVDSSSNIGTFAWLSDTHLDQLYGAPGAEIHKKGAPCNATSAPKYSAYGCGGSLELVTAAVAAAANATHELGWPDLDFLLFTGDNTRHNSQDKEVVLKNIATVQSLFAEYFPNTTVVELPALDLGNNDFSPNYHLNVTSHEPCLPTPTSSLPQSTNEWLETLAEQQSDMFATELERATFACGGYLNRAISDKLHVIVLNTAMWSLSHSPKPTNVLDKEDPFGQFEWLATQLSELRDAGKKAYVTGHIPPILQSFTGNLGQPLYPVDRQQRLTDIMSNHSEAVAGIFFAHVHSNELRHIPSFSDNAPPMFIGGSIAPGYTTNPTFSIVQYDREGSSYPIDMATFTIDLGRDIIPDNNDVMMNPFNLTFPSLLDYLGMESLTNKEVIKLSNKMLPGSGKTDDVIWNRYFNNWYKGAPQTACDTLTCQRGEACLVACGFEIDSWQSCNASSNGLTAEAACNFGGKDDHIPTPQPTEEDKSFGEDMKWTSFSTLLLMCASFLYGVVIS